MKRFELLNIRGSRLIYIAIAMTVLVLSGCKSLDMRCQRATERVDMHEGTPWLIDRQITWEASTRINLNYVAEITDEKVKAASQGSSPKLPEKPFCKTSRPRSAHVENEAPLERRVLREIASLVKNEVAVAPNIMGVPPTDRTVEVEDDNESEFVDADAPVLTEAEKKESAARAAAFRRLASDIARAMLNSSLAVSESDRKANFGLAIAALGKSSGTSGNAGCEPPQEEHATSDPTIPNTPIEVFDTLFRGKELFLSREALEFSDGQEKIPLYLLNEGLTCRPRGKDWSNFWRCNDIPNATPPPSRPFSALSMCTTRLSRPGDRSINFFGVLDHRYCVGVSLVERKGFKKSERRHPTNIQRDSVEISIACAKGGGSSPGAVAGGSRPNSIAPPESS